MKKLFVRITNENNSSELIIFDQLILILFWLTIVGSLIWGITDAVNWYTDLPWILNGFTAVIIWTYIGVIVAFINLIIRRIILRHLVNLEDTKKELIIIRKNIVNQD